jgi:AraC-like DNA-binding protein/uncharacterized cupin superfamily protein
MKAESTNFNQRQIMQNKSIEIFHYRDPYFKSLDFHSHDFFEIYFFLDGSVTYYIEENVYELMTGDVLIIPPGKMHRPVISNSEKIYERVVLWLDVGFISSLGNNEYPLINILNESTQKIHLIHFENDDFTAINDILNILTSKSDAGDYGYDLLLKSYVTILIILINKQFSAVEEHRSPQQKIGIIPKVIAYINEHIQDDLNLDTLSGIFFISKYHLIRKFKVYTNSTVYDYIISKRIVFAKRLMRQGVSAINASRQCGFKDYSNFYKAFIRKAGVTPKQFKCSCLQENGKGKGSDYNN